MLCYRLVRRDRIANCNGTGGKVLMCVWFSSFAVSATRIPVSLTANCLCAIMGTRPRPGIIIWHLLPDSYISAPC